MDNQDIVDSIIEAAAAKPNSPINTYATKLFEIQDPNGNVVTTFELPTLL
jgi:hypothetical protein